MEKEALIRAMKRSISEVLETMFFLPVDFPADWNREALWKPGAEGVLVAKLEFSGPISGSFHFFIPEALTVSLTASFLGEKEENVTRAHVTDMVKEIVNMIAGNTFSILDDQAVFDLKIPEILDPKRMVPGQVFSEGAIFVPIQTIDHTLGLQLLLLS